MNGRLSIQSSQMCDDDASLTHIPAVQHDLHLAGINQTRQARPMMSQTLNHKKLMLLMALCLVFATAIPMIVLAAS